MEVLNENQTILTSPLGENLQVNNDTFEIITNWEAVDSSKQLENVVSRASVRTTSSDKMNLDEIVDDESCLEIRPKNNDEPCTIDIKMKSGHKIVRIGIVSEASVLEIFREFGEYAMTVFAEFVDEFAGATVYYAEMTFNRPTPEISIKFTRIKNDDRSTMFLYGIRLILEESEIPINPPDELDFNLIANLLKMSFGRQKNEKTNLELPESLQLQNNSTTDIRFQQTTPNNNQSVEVSENTKEDVITSIDSNPSLRDIVDKKLNEMENRIMEKIDQFEARTNKRLDDIVRLLESINNPG